MSKIAILPEILCNQIAAGEVVERPAAVVKELVENSIDARSTKILVSLLQGGRKEIRVVDNGCGMDPEDALLALERHATSKIRSADDLKAIETLGFRGEAIPSIASVSRFELISRQAEALAGTSIKVEGGVLRDVREKGCPAGTQVLVRDLFYCVPARRKFLRTVETELAYITDQFLRISLANPEIHMQLFSEDRAICDFTKSDSLSQRAAQVLGLDLSRSLNPVDFEKNGLRLTGFLAPPDVQRTNAQNLFLFVNSRPVWDKLLQRAVLSAYEALIPRGKFPVAVLFLEIAPSLVDVNVHPTKREIRFRNPGEVIGAMREALLGAISGIRPKPHGFSGGEGAFFPKRQAPEDPYVMREQQASFRRPYIGRDIGYRMPEAGSRKAEEGGFGPLKPEVPYEYSQPATGNPELQTGQAALAYSALPVIGQLGNSFILLEAPDGLVIIDQHAAHERILFNTLGAKTWQAAQLLVRPAIIDVLPKEAVALKKLTSSLSDLGFEIEPFGGSSFAVHAVPAALAGFKPEDLLRDFLRFAEEEFPATQSEILSGLAKVASCHGAVRAGQRLKREEIKHLLESLDSTQTPFTCPHGRPLAYKLTYDQIFRFFKRT